jgi:hypothetical protein
MEARREEYDGESSGSGSAGKDSDGDADTAAGSDDTRPASQRPVARAHSKAAASGGAGSDAAAPQVRDRPKRAAAAFSSRRLQLALAQDGELDDERTDEEDTDAEAEGGVGQSSFVAVDLGAGEGGARAGVAHAPRRSARVRQARGKPSGVPPRVGGGGGGGDESQVSAAVETLISKALTDVVAPPTVQQDLNAVLHALNSTSAAASDEEEGAGGGGGRGGGGGGDGRSTRARTDAPAGASGGRQSSTAGAGGGKRAAPTHEEMDAAEALLGSSAGVGMRASGKGDEDADSPRRKAFGPQGDDDSVDSLPTRASGSRRGRLAPSTPGATTAAGSTVLDDDDRSVGPPPSLLGGGRAMRDDLASIGANGRPLRVAKGDGMSVSTITDKPVKGREAALIANHEVYARLAERLSASLSNPQGARSSKAAPTEAEADDADGAGTERGVATELRFGSPSRAGIARAAGEAERGDGEEGVTAAPASPTRRRVSARALLYGRSHTMLSPSAPRAAAADGAAVPDTTPLPLQLSLGASLGSASAAAALPREVVERANADFPSVSGRLHGLGRGGGRCGSGTL